MHTFEQVVSKIEVCDPMTPTKDGVAFMGPLVSKMQRDKVIFHV